MFNRAVVTVNCALCAGECVAIKILEDIAGNEEEIEDEYLALRDLSIHPNIPSFHGLYFVSGSKQLNDQLWFVMEVRVWVCLMIFHISSRMCF